MVFRRSRIEFFQFHLETGKGKKEILKNPACRAEAFQRRLVNPV